MRSRRITLAAVPTEHSCCGSTVLRARRCVTTTTRSPLSAAAASASTETARLACSGMVNSGYATQSGSGTTGRRIDSGRTETTVRRGAAFPLARPSTSADSVSACIDPVMSRGIVDIE